MKRRTEQRRAILEIMAAADRPLSPQAIRARAQHDVPGLGIATVYRTLKHLVDCGRARIVEIPGHKPRYELAGGEHHHYFYCRACDRVLPVKGCTRDLERLTPQGSVLEGHEVLLYGLCGECRSTVYPAPP